MEEFLKKVARYATDGYYWLCDLPQDKLLHVVVSAALTAVLSHVIPYVGLLIVMTVVFVTKELYDKVSGKGKAEWGDLLADYIGFFIGIL